MERYRGGQREPQIEHVVRNICNVIDKRDSGCELYNIYVL